MDAAPAIALADHLSRMQVRRHGVASAVARAMADVVASELRIAPQPGLSVTGCIVHALAGRKMLVVLDNWGHLLEAGALVEAILAGDSTVSVLATSREPFGLAAEQQCPVPPLGVAHRRQHVEAVCGQP